MKILDAEAAEAATRDQHYPEAVEAQLLRWLELGWVEAGREQGQLAYRPTEAGKEHIAVIAKGLPR